MESARKIEWIEPGQVDPVCQEYSAMDTRRILFFRLISENLSPSSFEGGPENQVFSELSIG